MSKNAACCGSPSAYAVISQRIRLNQQQNQWFSNAYLTAGMGNGEFRSLMSKFAVQLQPNARRVVPLRLLARRTVQQHCRRAVLMPPGQPPIAAAAVEVYGFNAIGEWAAATSTWNQCAPLDDLGLVFTSMWNNLIRIVIMAAMWMSPTIQVVLQSPTT